jgi:hypothetical protein
MFDLKASGEDMRFSEEVYRTSSIKSGRKFAGGEFDFGKCFLYVYSSFSGDNNNVREGGDSLCEHFLY